MMRKSPSNYMAVLCSEAAAVMENCALCLSCNSKASPWWVHLLTRLTYTWQSAKGTERRDAGHRESQSSCAFFNNVIVDVCCTGVSTCSPAREQCSSVFLSSKKHRQHISHGCGLSKHSLNTYAFVPACSTLTSAVHLSRARRCQRSTRGYQNRVKLKQETLSRHD